MRLDRCDGDQRQAKVADFLQQAVQRGLIDDRTLKDTGAVALRGEGEPVEPGGPTLVEVAGDADLVVTCLVPTAHCWSGVLHVRNLGTDVVSRDHQMW